MDELDGVSANTGYAFNTAMKKWSSCLRAFLRRAPVACPWGAVPGFLVSHASAGSPQRTLFLGVLGQVDIDKVQWRIEL